MRIGEEIKLRGTGRVIVTDPTGTAKAYEAGPGRTVTLTPNKVGVWSYVWENGRTDTFPVEAATSLTAGPPEPMAAIAEDEDRNRLSAMVDAKSIPPLSEDDLDAILSEAAVGDTYDFNAAAAAGWRIKAARAVSLTTFSVADLSVSREQIFTHAMAMADEYGSKGSSVGGSSRRKIRSLRTVIDYDEREQGPLTWLTP